MPPWHRKRETPVSETSTSVKRQILIESHRLGQQTMCLQYGYGTAPGGAVVDGAGHHGAKGH